MSSGHSLFTLRPNIPVAVIPVVLLSLFVGAWLGWIVRGFSRSWTIGIIVSILLFVIIVFFRFMNLKARRYIFFPDKAEFYEGFFNIVQRTVQYEKVTDCVLTRTIWDRLFGTGTISFMTAGHVGGNYGYGWYGLGGGIRMAYLEHPNDIYRKVQELLKKK